MTLFQCHVPAGVAPCIEISVTYELTLRLSELLTLLHLEFLSAIGLIIIGMNCSFTTFSKIFQSYQNDGRVIMNLAVQTSAVFVLTGSCLQQVLNWQLWSEVSSTFKPRYSATQMLCMSQSADTTYILCAQLVHSV